VHLARHHPDAVVHAFEPGREVRGHLERNAARYPNIVVHPFGLGDTDRDDVPLYHAEYDIESSVLLRPDTNRVEHELIQLRDGGAWASAAGIDRIDILKVDVEGFELEVLDSFASLLPTVKVLYLEYDSRLARRRIMSMLDETHELYFAMLMALDQGECIFVRNDYADVAGARPRLREIFAGASGVAPGGE
jgi:FkbM family methyltransferase